MTNETRDYSIDPGSADIERMHELASGQAVSASLYALVQLNLVDRLLMGPRSALSLAKEIDANEDALYRLLRTVACLGVLEESGERVFELTPLGATLRADSPRSLRPFVLMTGADWHREVWGELTHSVKTGSPSFVKIHGTDLFSFMHERRDVWQNFNETMTSLSTIVNDVVPDVFDFSRFQRIVDIGGGHGSLIAAILRKNPEHVKGVLFDLPEVIRGAEPHLARLGVRERCELIPGNFDAGIPLGGDVYIIKRFLHGFDDARCIATLDKLRGALEPGGRVLVIEMVVAEPNRGLRSKVDDLEMLTLTRWGRERTLGEYEDLFRRAGLALMRAEPLPLDMYVIEGSRAH
ncbi:MAG TPA: methyltransferase [Polyangiaceae bacterium]|nr:methyltransferase [Polyangiaceae bacterium]